MAVPASLSSNTNAAYVCASTPAGSVPTKRGPEAEDFDLDFPEDNESTDTSDDSFSPEDDSDLEMSDSDDDEESIGLDTAVGFEDGTDDLELSDEGEGENWSGDSEDSEDLPGTDADLLQGEEYGWIDEEADSDDDESFDPDMLDDEAPQGDDGGAEGLDDDDLDELDLSHLPELGSDQDDEAGSVGDLFEELPGLADEPTMEVAPGDIWKALAPASVQVTRLLRLPAACTGLAMRGTHLFVAAAGLWELSADNQSLQPLPLPAANVSDLIVTELDGVVHLGVIADGKAFVSHDGGSSFNAPPQPEAVTAIAFTAGAQAPVLWCMSSAGTLRSGQRRESQAVQSLQGKVVGLYGDGDRRLVALVRRQGRLWLAVSRDAGKRCAYVEMPASVTSVDTRVFGCRDALLLAGGDAVFCAVPPQGFLHVPQLLAAPALLSDEDDEAFLYGFVRQNERLLLVRRAARANETPTVIAAFGPEFGSEPEQLAVSYLEAGAISIYVASSGWLLRVDASLDGEDLA